VTRARRTAALSGLAVVAVYVVAAAISGHLSVLARRPLLDGVTPAVPYKWVDPPRALAATNQEPSSGTFQVELTPNGSKTQVLTTDDAQVTLILSKGAFAASKGDTYVQVTLTPLAPKAVTAPQAPLKILGNVIQLQATYQPSGNAAPLQARSGRIVLVYPLVVGVHAHAIVSSTDGKTWTTPDTNDLPSIQQADALIDGLGYAAVASTPAPATPSTSGGGGGGSSTATIVIVGALIVLAVAAVVVMRGRPSAEQRRRRPASRGGGQRRTASRSARDRQRRDRRR
jgi:hypothetical protein